jgi:hypothetical protein
MNSTEHRFAVYWMHLYDEDNTSGFIVLIKLINNNYIIRYTNKW